MIHTKYMFVIYYAIFVYISQLGIYLFGLDSSPFSTWYLLKNANVHYHRVKRKKQQQNNLKNKHILESRLANHIYIYIEREI